MLHTLIRSGTEPQIGQFQRSNQKARKTSFAKSAISAAVVALAIFCGLTLYDFIAGNSIQSTVFENILIGVIWALIVRPIFRRLEERRPR